MRQFACVICDKLMRILGCKYIAYQHAEDEATPLTETRKATIEQIDEAANAVAKAKSSLEGSVLDLNIQKSALETMARGLRRE